MEFASQVADRANFMDAGQIVDQNTPSKFAQQPAVGSTKLFLSQIPSR